MIMPGRSYGTQGRYTFNGKETDKETGLQDYGMRIYDPRLGRFLSVDPLSKEVPWNSSYAYAENDVIRSIDLDGLEKVFVIANPFGGPPSIFCFGCGIAEAANNYIGGTVQKDMVENRQMSYHNDNVPAGVQDRLDKRNTVEANGKIATGIAQTIRINVETSADVASMIIPLGELKIGGKFLSKVTEFFGGKTDEAIKALKEEALDFKVLEEVKIKNTHGPSHHGMEFLDDGIRMKEQPLMKDLVGFRKDHILNRHASGAGISGKTEFPVSWSNERIIEEINKIANDLKAPGGMGKWNSPYKTGTVDGIEIRVDFYPTNHARAGQVSTAYPINTAKNP